MDLSLTPARCLLVRAREENSRKAAKLAKEEQEELGQIREGPVAGECSGLQIPSAWRAWHSLSEISVSLCSMRSPRLGEIISFPTLRPLRPCESPSLN